MGHRIQPLAVKYVQKNYSKGWCIFFIIRGRLALSFMPMNVQHIINLMVPKSVVHAKVMTDFYESLPERPQVQVIPKWDNYNHGWTEHARKMRKCSQDTQKFRRV